MKSIPTIHPRLLTVFLIVLVLSGVRTPSTVPILNSVKPAKAAVSYNRAAAVNFAQNNWNNPGIGSGFCTGLAGGAMQAGGLSGPNVNWSGNHQLVSWVDSNPDKAQIVKGVANRQPGDIIFFTYLDDAGVSAQWPYSFTHSGVYLGNDNEAQWNGQGIYNIYAVRVNNGSGQLVTPNLWLLHINDTPPPAPPNVNLLHNSDFSNGLAYWELYQNSAYVNGAGQLVLGTGNGTVSQASNYSGTSGSVLQLSFYLGNTSSSAQTFMAAIHRVGSWSGAISCNFTVPANTQLGYTTIRGKNDINWENIQVEFGPVSSSGGLVVDNVVLVSRPDVASYLPSTAECAPYPQDNVELARDRQFANIPGNWTFYGSGTTYTVQNGIVQLTANSDGAGVTQTFNYTVDGTKAELKLKIGNLSSTPRSVRLSIIRHVYAGASTDIYPCYITLPANSPPILYTVRAYINVGWENTRVDLGVPAGNYTIAEPSFKAIPSLSIAPNTTECSSVTPTPASTPTFTPTATMTSTSIPPRPDTIGVYNAGFFYLRNSNSTGSVDITARFGGDPSDFPVAGDWNGDGVDTIGVYRSSTGVFFLSDSNTSPAANYTLTLGNPGDTPLAGRWDNTMTHDGAGVYRDSNGILYLRKQLTTGFSDYDMVMGNPGDQGIAGDWDDNGFDSVGVYRPSNTHVFLSNVNGHGITFSDIDFDASQAQTGSYFFAGDFNATGVSHVGWSKNGLVALKLTHNGNTPEIGFAFGPTGARPIAGKWVTASGSVPVSILAPSAGRSSTNAGDNSAAD